VKSAISETADGMALGGNVEMLGGLEKSKMSSASALESADAASCCTPTEENTRLLRLASASLRRHSDVGVGPCARASGVRVQ
jgi:hypothetical protein